MPSPAQLAEMLLEHSDALEAHLPPYLMAELAIWHERIRAMVKPKRYGHVMRVAALSYAIAEANGLDADRAFTAGLLHDVARDLSCAELLRLAPAECPQDACHALAVHGRAGRALLSHWGYRDTEVLEAVEDHTTGPRVGNPLSKVVYIADVSEPGRGVNADIRDLAFEDLDAALERAIFSKVEYLQSRGTPVHPRTLAVCQSLKFSSSLTTTLAS